MTNQLRVRAVGDGLLPLVAPDGATMMGRFAGRDREGHPISGGELVIDSPYYRMAIAHGALELIEEVPATKGGE